MNKMIKKLWQKEHNQKGFTLVELLLYLGLFSFLLLTLTEIIITVMEIRASTQALSAVQQDSRYILARFMNDVEHASTITTPASLGSSSSSMQLVIDGTTYTYAVAGDNLTISVGSSSAQLNGSETIVSSPTFQKIGNVAGKETVRISLTVQSKAVLPIGRETRSIQTTVGRR